MSGPTGLPDILRDSTGLPAILRDSTTLLFLFLSKLTAVASSYSYHHHILQGRGDGGGREGGGGGRGKRGGPNTGTSVLLTAELLQGLLAEHLVPVMDALELAQLLVEGHHLLKLLVALDGEVLRLGVHEELLQPLLRLLAFVEEQEAVVLEVIAQQRHIVQRVLPPGAPQQLLLLLLLLLGLGGDGGSQTLGLGWSRAQRS